MITIALPSYQVYCNGLGASAFTSAVADVWKNEFNNSSDKGTCMYFANSVGKTKIHENTNAIWLISGTSVLWELGILDSRGVVTYDNFFTNPLVTDGIHISGVTSSLFCNNTIDDSKVGFHAFDNNLIDLAQTKFNDADISLYLDRPYIGAPEPIIGLQPYKANCWSGTNLYWEALNSASTAFNVLLSEIDVISGDPCNPTVFSPAYWIDPNLKGPENKCQEQVKALIEGDEEELSNMTWERSYEWYYEIMDRGPLNDFEANFLAEMQNTKIPDLLNMENRVSAIPVINTSNTEIVDSLNEIKKDLQNSIAEINLNYINTYPTLSDSLLIDQYLSDILAIDNQLFNISELAISEEASYCQATASELANLAVTTLEETTYKQYLGLVLDVRMNGVTEDNQTLASILSQNDPQVYGHGARKANHFMSSALRQAYLNGITQYCTEDHHEMREKHEISEVETNSSSWRLSNLDNNQFNLVNSNPNCTEFNLYSINGALIKSGTLQLGENNLDFSNFAFGIYIIKCKSDKKVEKIILSN